MTSIIATLKEGQRKAQAMADAYAKAIAALDGGGKKKKGHIGAKGRRNIREAQKARWQKFHKQQQTLAKGK